jgi:DNA-directed RNA polymerase sigma subunit (sigma70/sigma32)
MASWGPVTLEEISRIYGVTRERIRQIAHNEGQKSGAVAKLRRSWLTRRRLRDFR